MRPPPMLPIALVGAALGATILPSPEAEAKVPAKPFSFSEKYSEKLKRFSEEGDVFYDTLPSLKTKVQFKVPFDAESVGTIDGDTPLYFAMGEFEWSDFLSSEDSNWKPGKSAAKWVYRDFDEETERPLKPHLTVVASWKRGVLKVKIQGRLDSEGSGALLSGERIGAEEAYAGEEFEAEAFLGEQGFGFAGTLDGLATVTTVTKGEEEFELSRVVLAGKADSFNPDEEADAPEITINSPWADDDILDPGGTGVTLDFDVFDESHITALAYKVDGGILRTLEFTEEDGGDGTWSVHVEVDVTLGNGTHTIEVFATDEWGNSALGEDNSVTFTYSNDDPV